MRIVLSADHRGAADIRQLHEKLRREGKDAELIGDCSGSPCDYPDRAYQVGQLVGSGKADLGVLVCGTGIGMSIAANKVRGVRAAVCHDELTAQLSRSHNDSNVLCLSADLLGQRLIEKIAEVWVATPFEGGRHARRIHKTISRLQGLFIKVGQLISIMTNFLPEEFRSELEGLQDQVPPRPYSDVEKRIHEELGKSPKELPFLFRVLRELEAHLEDPHHLAPVEPRKVDAFEDLGRARRVPLVLEESLDRRNRGIVVGIEVERRLVLLERAIDVL